MAPRRRSVPLARLVAPLLLSCASAVCLAAELGKATVRSGIGQPLNVEIEILGLKAGEDKTLAPRLASREAYGKAKVEFSPALSDVRASLGRRDGRAVVVLRSARPIGETHVEALVQLRSSTGTAVRRYTLLLDPQGYAARQPAAAASPKPKPKPAPKAPAAAAAAPSRDELFGVAPTAPATAPAEKSGGMSRDDLFGTAAAPGSQAANEAKPLEWRGFIQNTTAYDFREPGHWSRAVVRTQLGTQGGSGNFKWKASVRLDVDPVYFNTSHYPEAVRHDQRADFMLRENYIDTSLGGLQFRLGKQHIVWGEMVGLFFADVVSARDERDFILPDFDIIRIPQWAARIERFGENSHAELIWLPYPEVNNIGKPGAEFYPVRVPPPPGFDQQFNEVVGPERNLKNSNLGLRASTLQKGWDLSAFYYRSTDVNPTFYRDVVLGPAPALVFTPRHDRIWQAGSTLAKDFRSFVGKAEVIYTSGRKFNVTRLSEPEGVVSQKTLDWVAGLDFTFGQETRFNVQYFERVFYDHDPDLLQDRREGGVTLLLATKVGESLRPELLVIQSVNRAERLARAKLGWAVSRNWRAALGVDAFTGPPTGFFGRFTDRDRAYLEARFDF